MKMTLFKREIQVIQNTGNTFQTKYSIQGSFGSLLKNTICPNKAPLCCLRKTKFNIIEINEKEQQTLFESGLKLTAADKTKVDKLE